MSTISTFAFVDDNNSHTAPKTTRTDRRTPKQLLEHYLYLLRLWLIRRHIWPTMPRFYRMPHLAAWMQLAKMDRLDLSYRTNMPQLHIWAIEHGFPCTLWTLCRIAEVLGVESGRLKKAPGDAHTWPAMSWREAARHTASHRYPSTQVLVVPTTRIQAVELDGELGVYMSRLWYHTPCDENGIGDEPGEIAPEIAAIMQATGLELEPVLQIVYTEVPAPISVAQTIAKTLDKPLLWLIDF